MSTVRFLVVVEQVVFISLVLDRATAFHQEGINKENWWTKRPADVHRSTPRVELLRA